MNRTISKPHHLDAAPADDQPLRVVKVEYETYLSQIVVILFLSFWRTGYDPTSTDIRIIKHEDFEKYLADNNLLQTESGEWDDPVWTPISYTEALKEYVTYHDIAQYLQDKKLATDYVWEK